MGILLLIVVGVAFTAFAALVFAVLTIVLDWLDIGDFAISGPEGWSFWEFYKRYLIIAAVYTFVSLPLGNGLLGIVALAVAYKFVFDAGWVQALVIGIVGGFIAFFLFILLISLVVAPLTARVIQERIRYICPRTKRRSMTNNEPLKAAISRDDITGSPNQ